MKTRLAHAWETLHTSFWFMPVLLSIAAMLLAAGTLSLDRRGIPVDVIGLRWVYGGEPDGAREMLAVIAGSMLNVAGIVFSITIAALSLASSSLGSRLLRNFMRDRTNQTVLGIFIAIFVYCLLVLRTVRDGDGQEFVPHLSVTVGVSLALVGLAALIYFIHHISQSIRAEKAIADVARELEHAIDRFFPRGIGTTHTGDSDEVDAEIVERLFQDSAPILADSDGYVEVINAEELMSLAMRRDIVVRIMLHPGNFVIEGDTLALVHPSAKVDDALVHGIKRTITLGYERTPTQDIEFSITQMVQIALRALSPSINDPHTAVICIDWLGASLGRAAQREFPSPYRHDQMGGLRVVARPITFEDMVDHSFDQIRQAGAVSVGVVIRLLETMADLLEHLDRPERREAVLRQALALHRAALREYLDENDRQDVEARMRRVFNAAQPLAR